MKNTMRMCMVSSSDSGSVCDSVSDGGRKKSSFVNIIL
jgi:hypothetical protein